MAGGADLIFALFHEIKVLEGIFGECLNYKSGLRILIWLLEVPFFLAQIWALLAKVTVFGPQIGSKFGHKFMAEFGF